MATTKLEKFTRGRCAAIAVGVLCGLGALGGSALAQFQMPDPKQMAGIPRPVDDLPAGSVSVRLIRGQLSNNIAGHPVELHVGGKVLTVNTDEAGRAQFDKLTPGATVQAIAVVDGERLESQEFPAPAQGGIRLMLVATDKAAAAQKSGGPAKSGAVVLGGETRIVLEPGDEVLDVYYLLEIVNNAAEPVDPPTPFRFDMPAGAQGTTLMDGSSPLATTSGAHVTVNGPFPPGRTTVQVACQVPVTSGSMDIVQSFPADLERLAVLVRKVGDTKLASAQLQQQRDIPNEGQIIIGAMGGAVAAGRPITLSLSELPHHSQAPRLIALSIAGLIVLGGVWAAGRTGNDPTALEGERKRLMARREKLLAELVRLENDHRSGRGDRAKYAARREDLIASLENVYSALDDPDGPVGVAA